MRASRGSSASRSTTTDMTKGKALPTIVAFAIPVLIGNLFQQLYSMTDAAVVGRGMGALALAAVGTTSPVTQLLLGLVIGMSSGISVVVAQQFGSGDAARTKIAIANGALIMAALSLAVTAAGLCLCRSLFRLIRTPAEIVDGASLYAAILFSGAAASAAYNYEAGVMRAFGNSVAPLVFLTVTSLLNVALDLVFVLLLRWGLAGAAVATVLSQAASALGCFLYMKRRVPEARLSRADWTPDWTVLRLHLKTGLPMAFFSSLLAVSFLVLQSALNSLGSADVAAYTAASKMDNFVYQILGAFGAAVSTFAAQNTGKGEYARVREGVRKSLGVTVALSLALTAFVYCFGQSFMRLFVDPSEAEILASGARYMRVTSALYCILGVNFVIRFALIGVGKTAIPMLVGVSEILTRAAVTYFLVYRIGFLGMSFASPACWFTSTLLCALCYRPMMRAALRAKPALPLTGTASHSSRAG